MTRPVNPPPQLQIPRQFLSDPEARAFFDQQRTILFQLWQKSGGATDPMDSIGQEDVQVFNIYSQHLQRQIDGLPEFTIDTSGFTVDTSLLTTDKVLA